MNIDWNTLLTALGLAFILEGLPYALFADRLPALLQEMAKRGPGPLRFMGISAMLAGLTLVWFVRG